MNEVLVANWNSVVKPKDSVYHLGDVGFFTKSEESRKLLRQLHGRIFIAPGSHDRKRCLEGYAGIRFIEQIFILRVESLRIILCHYAMRSWPGKHYNSWHLFGHSHGRLENPEPLSCDVGVDCWEFKPVSLEQLQDFLCS